MLLHATLSSKLSTSIQSPRGGKDEVEIEGVQGRGIEGGGDRYAIVMTNDAL